MVVCIICVLGPYGCVERYFSMTKMHNASLYDEVGMNHREY